MGISFTDFSGGSSKANDFTISVGSSGNNVFSLDRAYDPGSYSITNTSGDTTFDIYAVAADGSYCGYTNTSSLDITEKFNKLVILGLPNNDQLFFNYRGKINAPATAGSVPTAGAYISSVSASSLEDIDDTTTITGGNFANDVEVYFIGQSNTETAAKNIVVTSVNQLIVTRPDSFDPDDSPYTIKVVNPGIPTPDGSNLFRLNNSITAGTLPSWITGNSVYYQISVSTSISLTASDTELSDISYTIVSGSLPQGLSLDSNTGTVSGSFSGTATDGDSGDIVVRATDAGGNFVDKTIAFIANGSPIWSTGSGSMDSGTEGNSYSFSLLASPGAANSSLTYAVVSGSLPTGLSINSSGSVYGTPSLAETSTFTIRVEDEFGNFADREFSIVVTAGSVDIEYLVIGGGGAGGWANPNGDEVGGGGGAGGYLSSVSGESSGAGLLTLPTFSAIPGQSYNVAIGAGGSGRSLMVGGMGNSSIFGNVVALGGGGGSSNYDNAYNAAGPGSGGAGNYAGASGVYAQFYGGGNGTSGGASGSAGAGGGGAGGAGQNGQGTTGGGAGGLGISSSITGLSVGRAGGGGGSRPRGAGSHGTASSGGGAGGSGATANTGGGGGGNYNNQTPGNGGSGVVILKYDSATTCAVGAGLTASTSTVGAYNVTEITAGIGTVSFS